MEKETVFFMAILESEPIYRNFEGTPTTTQRKRCMAIKLRETIIIRTTFDKWKKSEIAFQYISRYIDKNREILTNVLELKSEIKKKKLSGVSSDERTDEIYRGALLENKKKEEELYRTLY